VKHLLSIKAVRATASIDAQNTSGNTALSWAAYQDSMEVLKVLVEAGANPMIVNHDGETPMGIAQEGGHHRCIEPLQVSSKWLKLGGYDSRAGSINIFLLCTHF